MILIEHDDVIDDFSLAQSHPAFGRSVLPWTLEGRAPGPYAKALDRFRDVVGEDGVVVEDQILGSGVGGECLTQLLDHPWRGGIRGDVEVDDSSPTMVNDESRI